MDHEEDDAPSSKKIKLTTHDDDEEKVKLHQSTKPLPKCPDFVVSNLEDFYKPNPPFRLPVEVGSFSFDSQGQLVLDKSGLRYYYQPPKLGLDLRVGFDKFKRKLNQTPDLTNILTWISYHWDCFLPKLRGQGSIDCLPNDSSENSTSAESTEKSTRFHLRPDNLLTNFICWRGLMTKMLCTPYNKQEPWKLLATLNHGTIYLRELETDEKREKEANLSLREQEMCYWGIKFEDYMTKKDPPGTSSGTLKDTSGTVNSLEAFCTVVRTRLNTHSLVMAGEVDCIDHMSREKAPQSYIELKTNRHIYTDRNKASFKRYKLMKWWAQSFLVGIPKIVCGFRDDDGIINNLQNFRTVDIPRESQNDLSLWQANVCVNFLDELLKWIRDTVVKDDSKTVYLIEWKQPFTHISATCQSASTDLFVLPDWYLQKCPPSSSNKTESSSET